MYSLNIVCLWMCFLVILVALASPPSLCRGRRVKSKSNARTGRVHNRAKALEVGAGRVLRAPQLPRDARVP